MTAFWRRASLLIAGLFLGTQLVACSSQFAGGSPEESTPPPSPSKVVRVAHPQPATAGESYPSSLYAERDVLVTARRSGVIEQVLVDRGDRVRAGQPLAILETDLATRELEMAEQDLRLAEADHDKKQALFEENVIPEQERLRAEIARDQAASKVALARGWLERCKVRAPFDCTIVERWAVVGQRVVEDSGTPLFRIVAREPHRARVDVPEERLGGLAVGSEASVQVPGEETSFPARVVFVSPAIDAASGTAAVIVEMASRDGPLKLGASVRVHLDGLSIESESLLCIPREALPGGSVWNGRKATVLVISKGRAEARRVQVVGTRGGDVLVKGDIGPDDQVIVGAGGGLVEGDPVVLSGGTS